MMNLIYAAKLSLLVPKNDSDTQKIDSFFIKIYNMVIVIF